MAREIGVDRLCFASYLERNDIHSTIYMLLSDGNFIGILNVLYTSINIFF